MKPYDIYIDDNAEMSIEWIGKNARFCIWYTEDLSEHGWFYVNKDGEMAHGELPERLAERLRSGNRHKGLK